MKYRCLGGVDASSSSCKDSCFRESLCGEEKQAIYCSSVANCAKRIAKGGLKLQLSLISRISCNILRILEPIDHRVSTCFLFTLRACDLWFDLLSTVLHVLLLCLCCRRSDQLFIFRLFSCLVFGLINFIIHVIMFSNGWYLEWALTFFYSQISTVVQYIIIHWYFEYIII